MFPKTPRPATRSCRATGVPPVREHGRDGHRTAWGAAPPHCVSAMRMDVPNAHFLAQWRATGSWESVVRRFLGIFLHLLSPQATIWRPLRGLNSQTNLQLRTLGSLGGIVECQDDFHGLSFLEFDGLRFARGFSVGTRRRAGGGIGNPVITPALIQESQGING